MILKKPQHTYFRKTSGTDERRRSFDEDAYRKGAAKKEKKFAALHAFIQKERYGASGGRCLDAACGMGELGVYFQQNGYEVVSLDFDFTQAVIARTHRPQIRIVLGDLTAPPLKQTEPFDVIFLRHVVEHVPDAQTVLDMLWKILAPGGWMIIETPNGLNPAAADTRNYLNAKLEIRDAPYIANVYSLSELMKLVGRLDAAACRMIMPTSIPWIMRWLFLRVRVSHKIALQKNG